MRNRTLRSAALFALAVACAVPACGGDDIGVSANGSDGGADADGGDGGAGANGSDGGDGMLGNASVDASSDASTDASTEADAAITCGDGVVQSNEACDEGPCCDATCGFVVPAGAIEVKPGDD